MDATTFNRFIADEITAIQQYVQEHGGDATALAIQWIEDNSRRFRSEWALKDASRN